MEDAHLVVALEDRRLDVEATIKTCNRTRRTAAENLCAFVLADVDVGHDLLELIVRRLCADHRCRIKRVALDDRLGARDCLLHELVIDRLVHESTRWACADLTLVEGEHHEAFDCLVEEVVIGIRNVGHEDVGALAAKLKGDGDEVLRRVLHDEATRCGLAGECDLRDALVRCKRLACFEAEAVHDIQHTSRKHICDEFHQYEDRPRRLVCGLQHDAVTGGKRRCEFPARHQQREVPRNDLTDNTKRLMEVIRDGVIIEFGKRTFLCTDRASEVAEVINRKRHIRGESLAHRLAVVVGLRDREQFEIRFHDVRDLQQHVGTFRDARASPCVLRSMCGIKCELDVLSGRACDLADDLAING